MTATAKIFATASLSVAEEEIRLPAEAEEFLEAVAELEDAELDEPEHEAEDDVLEEIVIGLDGLPVVGKGRRRDEDEVEDEGAPLGSESFGADDEPDVEPVLFDDKPAPRSRAPSRGPKFSSSRYDRQPPAPRRPQEKSDAEMIAEWLANHTPTRLPSVATPVAPITALAEPLAAAPVGETVGE